MVTVADTAFSIAAVRAAEGARPDRLFDDPYAHLFAAGGAHAAEATARYFALPFFEDGVRLRTRWIDDAVRDSVAAGLGQLVIVGAGFDARALRMKELEPVATFEVDTAEQLDRKRAMLEAGGVALPARVAYVACDFGAPDFDAALERALAAAGMRLRAGAMFVWEGVIGYIDDSMIDRSLSLMARAGGPRSRVAFTFGPFTFDAEPAPARLGRLGFSAFEEHDGAELWRRYLPGEPHVAAPAMRVGLAKV